MQNKFGYKPINQVIAAFLISITTGWLITYELTNADPVDLILSVIVFLVVMVSAIWITRFFLKKYPLSKLIIYAFIISSFLGSGILSLKVGPVSLFPYRVLLPLAMLIFLFRWVKSKRISIYGSEPLKPILGFVFFWIAFALLSLTWAESFTDGVKDIIFLISGVFFIFLFVYLFQKQNDYMNLDYIWLLVLTFMVILGFWNHFSLQHLPVSRLYDAAAYVRHRPTAVFTNENDYASYLALSFFFALGVLHRSKYIIIKFFSGFLLISCLYQILVSSSRANLLALLIGGAIWFLFFTSKREKRFLLFFGGFSFIIASLLFPDRILSAYSEVISQFSSFFVPADYADASNDIRINLLKNTLLFIANSVGMGIGAGNVESYIEKYALFPTAGTLNVHNWWAEVFLHYGFFVFVGYLLVYLWLMVKLYRIFKESITWEDKLIAQSLCTSLVAFSVASISPSSLMTLNYAWILFALAIAFINYWMKKNLLDKK